MQALSGDPDTGPIEEGSGLGFQAIGRDLQGLMHIGCLAIGNPEEEAGSGERATGSTGS